MAPPKHLSYAPLDMEADDPRTTAAINGRHRVEDEVVTTEEHTVPAEDNPNEQTRRSKGNVGHAARQTTMPIHAIF